MVIEIALGIVLGALALLVLFCLGWLVLRLGLPALFDLGHKVGDWRWQRKVRTQNRRA